MELDVFFSRMQWLYWEPGLVWKYDDLHDNDIIKYGDVLKYSFQFGKSEVCKKERFVLFFWIVPIIVLRKLQGILHCPDEFFAGEIFLNRRAAQLLRKRNQSDLQILVDSMSSGIFLHLAELVWKQSGELYLKMCLVQFDKSNLYSVPNWLY